MRLTHQTREGYQQVDKDVWWEGTSVAIKQHTVPERLSPSWRTSLAAQFSHPDTSLRTHWRPDRWASVEDDQDNNWMNQKWAKRSVRLLWRCREGRPLGDWRLEGLGGRCDGDSLDSPLPPSTHQPYSAAASLYPPNESFLFCTFSTFILALLWNNSCHNKYNAYIIHWKCTK